MKNLQRKIRNAVDLYKQVFKLEYELVVKQINDARGNRKTEYGEVVTEDGNSHAIKRELIRIPEKLYNLIIQNLSEEELRMMDTKEYTFWFSKEFPQFSMSKN